MSVSKRLRYEVLRRDNFTCRYCGSKAPDVPLHVDHVIPESLGGTDDPSNLATACRDCNGGKSSTPPDAQQVSDANLLEARWRDAIAEAKRRKLTGEPRAQHVYEVIYDMWVGVHELPGRRAMDEITYCLESGLDPEDIIDAAEIAFGASHIPVHRMYPYFVGICRNRVAELHTSARSILEEGE